jgi:hypothetical protein
MDTLIMQGKVEALMFDFLVKWNEFHPGQRLCEDLQDEIHQYLLMGYCVGVDHTVEIIEKEIGYFTDKTHGSISLKKIKQIIINL